MDKKTKWKITVAILQLVVGVATTVWFIISAMSGADVLKCGVTAILGAGYGVIGYKTLVDFKTDE